MICKGRKKSLGFTLVEVVVALAVFVIVATFAFPIFLSSLNVNVGAHEKTKIQEVSQNYLEYIVSVSKNYKNGDELVDHLESIVHYGESTYDSAIDTLILDGETYTIKIKFDVNSNLIRLIGLSKPNNHSFETVEWLSYGI